AVVARVVIIACPVLVMRFGADHDPLLTLGPIGFVKMVVNIDRRRIGEICQILDDIEVRSGVPNEVVDLGSRRHGPAQTRYRTGEIPVMRASLRVVQNDSTDLIRIRAEGLIKTPSDQTPPGGETDRRGL